VIHVSIAVITASGETVMTTSNTETEANTILADPAEQPKGNKTAKAAKCALRVAPTKNKLGKKAATSKKAHEGAKSAKSGRAAKKESGAREGSKTLGDFPKDRSVHSLAFPILLTTVA
jgi:hypothetical protein